MEQADPASATGAALPELPPLDTFLERHLGPSAAEQEEMLRSIGFESLDALAHAAVPEAIWQETPLQVGPARGEHELLRELRALAGQNQLFRSYLGLGYHDCVTPPVIARNILENPGWYTQYTPYQAEISQGRLEMLVNFQTMVGDLTGLPLANASLLDEGTAAAEGMALCRALAGKGRTAFVASSECHPQTIEVVKTRAEPLGIEVHVLEVLELEQADFAALNPFGVLFQYPATDGALRDPRAMIERAHAAGALVVAATDLLALTMLTPPGELGADVAIGNSQRFGVPLGFGGPHAAFMATQEAHKRRLPGRIVGVSQDVEGRPAYRLALQTREQHIRRDKATSNICTAQVLLAVMSAAYAIYHGPQGLKHIAQRVHRLALALAEGLRRQGLATGEAPFFDTVRVELSDATAAEEVVGRALARRINLRRLGERTLCVALDETTSAADVAELLAVFGASQPEALLSEVLPGEGPALAGSFARQSEFLTHPVFHRHRSEHEMLRYLHRLQGKDLSLTSAMIPLGSCTMKLNGTSEMLPVSWPEFARLHPFAPPEQTRGYEALFAQLEAWLAEITGFSAVSLQPNAGSQGEYAGLLVIRAYHHERGEGHRDVCLIPASAHGTNPASAVMAGMKVVPVRCDEEGNIDLADLEAKASKHAAELAALMVTYPSTHGVFETSIRQITEVVHRHGGQVYLDGANLNAQVGLCRPGDYGADVAHLNLHKTFCIPHGGGGPGMGPIGVRPHLAPFLPGHPLRQTGGERAIGPVSAAPWGSPSILPISWVYIALLGGAGLRTASQVAILNANYMAKRLEEHYEVLYRGPGGLCAHEFILDFRPFKASAGITVEDVAKRLMDFGFHAPTMSWPVANTLMVEPTESESREELDRYCDALIAIRAEIKQIEDGAWPQDDNPLEHAPHPAARVCADSWEHAYTREQAAFPLPWVRERKFWPPVARIDNVYGDRHLVCTCPPLEAYGEG